MWPKDSKEVDRPNFISSSPLPRGRAENCDHICMSPSTRAVSSVRCSLPFKCRLKRLGESSADSEHQSNENGTADNRPYRLIPQYSALSTRHFIPVLLRYLHAS